MADNTVELGIEINGKSAIDSLKNIEKQTTSSVAQMEKAFGSLKTIAAAALAFFAGREVIQFFDKGIEAAIKQEQAMTNLETQLEQTGEASQGALDKFSALADELEKTTRFEDDQILTNIALAKSFGITNDQAEELIKAAADLSVATGKDLKTNVELLGKSYGGIVGPLDEVDTRLKGLTKEQLKNGEAVALLAKRFEGAAQNEVKTFSGAVQLAEKSFGNLGESFGKIITENKTLKATITAIGDLFAKLQSYVEANTDSIDELITTGIKALITSLSVAIDIVKFIGKGLGGLVQVLGLAAAGFLELADAASFGALDKFSESFKNAQKSIFNFVDNAGKKTEDFDNLFTKIGDAVDEVGVKIIAADNATANSAEKAGKARSDYARRVGLTADELKRLTDEVVKFEEALTKGASSEIEKISIDREINLKKIKEFESQRVITAKKSSELKIKVESDFNKKVLDLAEKTGKEQVEIAKKVAEESRKIIQDAASTPIEFIIKGGALNAETGAAIGVGIANSMLKGAEGARDLISKGIGAIADTIIPGIGGAVSELVSLLSKGPDATKEMVRQFVEAVPDIIIAIAESIPAVVEALVDSLINEGGIVRIAIALAQAMSGLAIWKAIGKQLGIEVGNKLTDGARQLGIKISDGFKDGVARIGQAFVEFGNQMSSLFTNFFAGLDVAFANAAQKVWDAISGAFVGVYEGLSLFFESAGQTLASAISNAFTNIFEGLKSALSFEFPSIPTPAWIKDITEAPGKIGEAFIQIPDKIASAVKEALGIGGGGSNNSVVGKLQSGFKNISEGKLPRFAEGGYVPSGFPNDTFPARLTSNEFVVNNDLTPKLEKFLDGEGNAVTNALLAKVIALLGQPMQVTTTANLNGKALADIILQLNRNNARLSA